LLPDKNGFMKTGPLVSILIPTYNRTGYLPVAIRSALSQDYPNIEVIVMRDGGWKINDVIESFSDPRLVFIDRDENRGKPYTLNYGLGLAKGKYICYLDDDDILYPNHVGTLLDILETKTDCLAAYSDLYRVYCRNSADGERFVLSKVLEISRDFDRAMMLHYNHVLHISMMHRKDLLEKTGLYNESLNILIDWDLFRRMVFFTDFYHAKTITGEFYSPIKDSDQISVKNRRDPQEYFRNVMTIRTTRPAKPWLKIKDLAFILDAAELTQAVGQKIKAIWETTSYPNTIYLLLSGRDIGRLNIDLPNVVPVEVSGTGSQRRIQSALAKCDAEYIAVVPGEFAISEFWVEDCLNAIDKKPMSNEVFEIEGSDDNLWAGIFEEQTLKHLVSENRQGSLLDNVKKAGLNIRKVQPDEIAFQYDQFLSRARILMQQKNFAKAAELFEYIAKNYGNELWISILAAQAHLKNGNLQRAREISEQLNRVFPSVESLITAAQAEKGFKNYGRAIELFGNAIEIIEGKQLIWA
jgi:glycosyltransferase involved in cell wall biosynthesis